MSETNPVPEMALLLNEVTVGINDFGKVMICLISRSEEKLPERFGVELSTDEARKFMADIKEMVDVLELGKKLAEFENSYPALFKGQNLTNEQKMFVLALYKHFDKKPPTSLKSAEVGVNQLDMEARERDIIRILDIATERARTVLQLKDSQAKTAKPDWAAAIWLVDNQIHGIYGPDTFHSAALQAEAWVNDLRASFDVFPLKETKKVVAELEFGPVNVLITERHRIEVWPLSGPLRFTNPPKPTPQ